MFAFTANGQYLISDAHTLHIVGIYTHCCQADRRNAYFAMKAEPGRELGFMNSPVPGASIEAMVIVT